MNMRLSVSAGALVLALSVSPVAATINLGGKFSTPTQGYVDAILNNATYGHDGTGEVFGDPIYFSSSPVFPHALEVSFDTPNYGEIDAEFSTLVSYVANQAGVFFTLGGIFNGTTYGTLAVNDVNPRFGSSSFGIQSNYVYTAPSPPPIEPPPSCGDCGPPVTTPTVPETSTWLMMLLGFAGLSVPAFRRKLATV